MNIDKIIKIRDHHKMVVFSCLKWGFIVQFEYYDYR